MNNMDLCNELCVCVWAAHGYRQVKTSASVFSQRSPLILMECISTVETCLMNIILCFISPDEC